MNNTILAIVSLVIIFISGCNEKKCTTPIIANDVNAVKVSTILIKSVRKYIKNCNVVYDMDDNKYSNVIWQDNIIEWIETDYKIEDSHIYITSILYSDVASATKAFDGDVASNDTVVINNASNRFAYSCPKEQRSDGEGGFGKMGYYLSGVMFQKNNLVILVGVMSSTEENTHIDMAISNILRVIKQL